MLIKLIAIWLIWIVIMVLDEKGLYLSGPFFHRQLSEVTSSIHCQRGGIITLQKNI